MAITHGMNPEEVNNLGVFLQNDVVSRITGIINDLNSRVSNTTWVGPDAVAFKDQWWPEHRNQLKAISDQLHGFGQSAKNNASEQTDVSRVR